MADTYFPRSDFAHVKSSRISLNSSVSAANVDVVRSRFTEVSAFLRSVTWGALSISPRRTASTSGAIAPPDSSIASSTSQEESEERTIDFDQGWDIFLLANDERVHHYQQGHTSITGLRLKLREIMKTGRLIGVACLVLLGCLHYSVKGKTFANIPITLRYRRHQSKNKPQKMTCDDLKSVLSVLVK